MKKHYYAVLLPLGLGLLCYSCGGKGSKTSPSAPVETSVIEEVDSTLMANDDDGDPNIKAASVDKMKMVVDSQGHVVGRYVRTNKDTYTVTVQDDFDVPISGNKVVVFSAKNGEGIVYTERKNVNVRIAPSTDAPAAFQISKKDDAVPETYPCLGKTQGWYKISVRGKEGYVRHDLVIWDGMSSF